MPHFPARAALADRPREYFISADEDGRPFLEIHLGPLARFQPIAVAVACVSPEFEQQRKTRFETRGRTVKEKGLEPRADAEELLSPKPVSLRILGLDGQGKVEILHDGPYAENEIDIHGAAPFASLRIESPTDSKTGSPYRFRVFQVQLRGQFLP
jgi:hypothetical protein